MTHLTILTHVQANNDQLPAYQIVWQRSGNICMLAEPWHYYDHGKPVACDSVSNASMFENEFEEVWILCHDGGTVGTSSPSVSVDVQLQRRQSRGRFEYDPGIPSGWDAVLPTLGRAGFSNSAPKRLNRRLQEHSYKILAHDPSLCDGNSKIVTVYLWVP